MYGNFIENTAGYEIKTQNLPTSWEYIYENRDVLLKVDQFGPVYAQASPPKGIMLFKREMHQKYSPWTVNIELTDDNLKFTNFFKPNKLDDTPEDFNIKYLPECCIYTVKYKGITVETELFIPRSGTVIVYRTKIKNCSACAKNIVVRPQLIPYLNAAVMAPWDKYEWYLDTSCENNGSLRAFSKLLSANANLGERKNVFFELVGENLTKHELSLEKYVGNGDIYSPDMNYTGTERIYGYPPVYATQHEWTLEAGQEKEITQILSMGAGFENGEYFDSEFYSKEKKARKAEFDDIFSKNKIVTGDKEFDQYVNYWLPIQMNWVASLDRGWPTGMRGSRDSAQDYTALLYIEPKHTRDIIIKMLECQRSDGWFPRQYSAEGRHGKHDLREYVDGGVFFAETMWKYLAHTKDYALLDEKVVWLDSDEASTVLDHFIKGVEYYICDENVGEHGLCKIREGDWLDSVNQAGKEGRGESVTVSAQAVMALKFLADILTKLDKNRDVSLYLEWAEKIKNNLNKYAYNSKGYYSGVFNDNGQWIFSDCDPDGKERVYGVSNYYAIVAGVAEKEKYNGIFEKTGTLKSDKGYRLFYPYLGEQPIAKVGRVASGDVPPFLVENGNVYNHGSQGFLARAFAYTDRAEELFDVLKWLMPYDVTKHPTNLTYTPPYAIVNCWQQLPGFDHRGLMCFLTGSIAMAFRGVYEWMFGIKPNLDGLVIDPCIPRELSGAEITTEYMGKKLTVKIVDNETVYVNGTKLTEKTTDIISGKQVLFVKGELL